MGAFGGSAGGGGGSGGGQGNCQVSSDCTLIPTSCCGQCGAATRDDSIALPASEVSDYRIDNCGPVVGCPACYQAQDPNLIAACVQNECRVVDVLELQLNACSTDADCRLRTHDCCECGGDQSIEGLISINASAEGDLVDLVCDPNTACDECAPLPPLDATPICDGGRCLVRWDGFP
jgi:hypothetical protein